MSNRAAEDLIAKVWADLQQDSRREEQRRAEAHPLAYKNSRTFPPGVSTSYRCYAVKSRGRVTRYCWSVNRNIAGFYIGWREVETKHEIKRDMWTSRRVRSALKTMALARYKAQLARLQKGSS